MATISKQSGKSWLETPAPAQYKCLKKAFEGALNLSPDRRNPLLIMENFTQDIWRQDK